MPAPNPQTVLKLAADMVAAQKQLESLQAEWDALFSNTPQEVRPPVSREVRKPLGGTASRVLEHINAHPDVPHNVETLYRIFGEDIDRKPIESALFNLHKANKIHRHSRGLYKSLHSAEAKEANAMEEVFKF